MPVEAPTGSMEIGQMSKVQKLAALLIILGAESAAHIMKHLDEHELETIVTEMAKIPLINQELQRDIMREFSEVAIQASTAVLGGIPYAQAALEKSVGLFRASDLINRIAPAHAPVPAMQEILGMEAREIFNLLKHEQPQTIALVISYLPATKSSQILVLFRSELRDQVVERLATLAPTPIEVVEKVVAVLNQKLGSKDTRALNQTGGIKTAADLLNAMDKGASKSLLISLEERNPDLGQAIRQKMFTFEDLASLDTSALQKILREVDMRDLAVALKTASDKLKKILLSAISRRAAETVREEISFMGPLKLRDIEASQSRIIESVRRLEAEGEIEITPTRNIRDEVLA